jgi:hypothetical protein
MRWALPIMLTLIAAAGAGIVYHVECTCCDYEETALFVGGGMNPLFSYAIYEEPAAQRLVSVGFDAAPLFFAALGVEAPDNYSTEFWELFNANYATYEEVMGSWEPPPVLTVDTKPDGLLVTVDGAPLTAQTPELIRVQELDDAACPRCGRRGLDFTQSGVWD